MRHDVGKVYVQLFDVTLEAYFGRHLLCIHAPTCGYGPALEHNGDLYSCDHFVEPGFKLGNIHETPMLELVASPQKRKFGEDKRDTLTEQCRKCEVRFLCNGGCPKDRFALSRDGEPGHNYLCSGLELFFTHTRPLMQAMGQLLPARPRARRSDGLDRSRRRQARSLSAMSLRQWTEIQVLPRRQGAEVAVRLIAGLTPRAAARPLPAPSRTVRLPQCRARGKNSGTCG